MADNYITIKGSKKNFYEFLGIAANASADEVRRAVKKAKIMYHPDHGGDMEIFCAVATRIEPTLSETTRRALYNLQLKLPLPPTAAPPIESTPTPEPVSKSTNMWADLVDAFPPTEKKDAPSPLFEKKRQTPPASTATDDAALRNAAHPNSAPLLSSPPLHISAPSETSPPPQATTPPSATATLLDRPQRTISAPQAQDWDNLLKHFKQINQSAAAPRVDTPDNTDHEQPRSSPTWASNLTETVVLEDLKTSSQFTYSDLTQTHVFLPNDSQRTALQTTPQPNTHDDIAGMLYNAGNTERYHRRASSDHAEISPTTTASGQQRSQHLSKSLTSVKPWQVADTAQDPLKQAPPQRPPVVSTSMNGVEAMLASIHQTQEEAVSIRQQHTADIPYTTMHEAAVLQGESLPSPPQGVCNDHQETNDIANRNVDLADELDFAERFRLRCDGLLGQVETSLTNLENAVREVPSVDNQTVVFEQYQRCQRLAEQIANIQHMFVKLLLTKNTRSCHT